MLPLRFTVGMILSGQTLQANGFRGGIAKSGVAPEESMDARLSLLHCELRKNLAIESQQTMGAGGAC
jgi:hypothetical protein